MAESECHTGKEKEETEDKTEEDFESREEKKAVWPLFHSSEVWLQS